MAEYKIVIGGSALKQLQKISRNDAERIKVAIDSLAENPRPGGVKKLKGISEILYRIRSGDYRVIYTIDDWIKIVDIRQIGNRKDIYR
jgi:mRNA interferase RelE/StbE